MPLVVQFSSSTAITSKIIRTICHSRFSHVDIVLPEGLLGASGPDPSINDPGGVRIRSFTPWPYAVKRQARLQISDAIADAVIAAAKSQIGKPFDNEALHAFLSPNPSLTRQWDALDKWFCSELFMWACRTGNLFPYKLAVPMNRINPNDAMIAINQFLPDKDVEGLLNGGSA